MKVVKAMAINAGSWIQDPETGELIPRHLYQQRDETGYYIQGDIEPFVSPIDKSVITDRKQLRQHMAKHGVTDSRDYSPEYIDRRAQARDRQMRAQDSAGKRKRVEHIIEAIERNRHG